MSLKVNMSWLTTFYRIVLIISVKISSSSYSTTATNTSLESTKLATSTNFEGYLFEGKDLKNCQRPDT